MTLKAFRHQFNSGIIHGFNGSIEEMNALVELDLYISINSAALMTRDGIEMVKEIPMDKLLLETDSPHNSLKPRDLCAKHVLTKFYRR